MKEMTARLSIMAVDDLTAAQKVIMLYLLTRVDWATWKGQVSTNDVKQGTSMSARNIKRSLQTLAELGYIERELMRRETGLHHKASITINITKISDRKSPPMVTESHHTQNDTGDRKSPQVVTESHHDTHEDSDRKSPPIVTESPKGSDRKSPRVVTESPKGSDRKSPNNNIDQYNINIDQSSLNTEVEQEPEAREEPSELYWEYERGSIWCDRCKQHVPNDRPHTYPHSKLICSDQEPTDKTLERAWDDAWDKHEPEPITEELRDGLWYVSRIDDRLAYRQEVHRQVKHHKRYDVRDALLIGDELFNKMTQELIAPQSAIDWVTLQASGHLPSISTPAAPPKASNVYTVTTEQQQRMKEIDRAWATGTDHTTKATNGW
jgi:hypothetical protein